MKTKPETSKPQKTTAAKTGTRTGYDFSKGIRGKYAKQYAQSANVVILDADVARVFKDSAAVNAALRTLLPKRSPARPTTRPLVVREKTPRYKSPR